MLCILKLFMCLFIPLQISFMNVLSMTPSPKLNIVKFADEVKEDERRRAAADDRLG